MGDVSWKRFAALALAEGWWFPYRKPDELVMWQGYPDR